MQHQDVDRWLGTLTEVREELGRLARKGGSVASLVGADPLSMEPDLDLDRLGGLLNTVIGEMRTRLQAEEALSPVA